MCSYFLMFTPVKQFGVEAAKNLSWLDNHGTNTLERIHQAWNFLTGED